MTSIRNVLGSLVIVVSFSACSVSPPKSSSQSYASVDQLKTYQTYELSSDRSLALRDPNRNTATAKGLIDQAVESGLQAKGLTRANAGSADLVINYAAGSRSMFSSQTFTESGEWSQGRIQESGGLGFERTGTINADYEQGRLFLNVKDRKTGKVVYAGTTEAELLKNPSSGRTSSRLRQAVRGLLKDWPRR